MLYIATLNRIHKNVPEYILRDLYYTLFESHLSYCISVWGGAAKCRTEPLCTTQKHCVRVLFGDREAFLTKFKTCVRARSLESQQLGQSFFKKEKSKPLFLKHKICSIHNLYTYHTIMEIFKILKFQSPMPLYSGYNISLRKKNAIVLNPPSPDFIYRSSVLWNSLASLLKVKDFSEKIVTVRNLLQNLIFSLQHQDTPVDWTVEDYNINKMKGKPY